MCTRARSHSPCEFKSRQSQILLTDQNEPIESNMNNSPVENTNDNPIDNLALDSLPFVLGILSNLAGHASPTAPVMERITTANFEHYLASIGPTLHLTCFPFIPGEHIRVDVQLDFKSMADFEVSGLRDQLLAKGETVIVLVNALIDAIMHDPDFMRLEASWRNLSLLIEQYSAAPNVQIMVGCCSKSTLPTGHGCPIAGWLDLDQIHHATLPRFTAILFDFEFSHHPSDLDILEHLGASGAKHQTLILCSADPELFGMEHWTGLPIPRSVAKIFGSNDYREWNRFRQNEAAKWIFMTVCKVLLRVPNAMEWELQQSKPFCSYNLCWTNSATYLAAVLLEQHKNGIYLEKLGGTKNASVKSLSTFSQQLKSGETVQVFPTEVSITKARIQELESLGLNTLVRHSDPGNAFFPHLVCLATVNESEENLEQKHTASSKHWNSISLRMLSSRMEHLGLVPADIETILKQ